MQPAKAPSAHRHLCPFPGSVGHRLPCHGLRRGLWPQGGCPHWGLHPDASGQVGTGSSLASGSQVCVCGSVGPSLTLWTSPSPAPFSYLILFYLVCTLPGAHLPFSKSVCEHMKWPSSPSSCPSTSVSFGHRVTFPAPLVGPDLGPSDPQPPVQFKGLRTKWLKEEWV